MIYFDNAATGGFKPRAVTDAVENVTRYLSANPGRSAHRLSITGADIVYNTRAEISKTFNCQPERVIFTKNCTESLNLAIFGTLKVGGHIITTVYEHNSVLRPLTALQNKGLISLDVVKPYKPFLIWYPKEKPLEVRYETHRLHQLGRIFHGHRYVGCQAQQRPQHPGWRLHRFF